MRVDDVLRALRREPRDDIGDDIDPDNIDDIDPDDALPGDDCEPGTCPYDDPYYIDEDE